MSYQAFRPSYRHLVSALAELKLRRNRQWMASADAPKRRERYWVFKQNKTARRRSLCNLIGRVTRFPLRRSAASIVLPAVMRARAKIGFRILASLRARSARLSTQFRRSKSRVKRDRECTAHLPVAHSKMWARSSWRLHALVPYNFKKLAGLTFNEVRRALIRAGLLLRKLRSIFLEDVLMIERRALERIEINQLAMLHLDGVRGVYPCMR
jgi:hypothetical protein